LIRICDILTIAEEALKKKGIENARLNAELLLASVLNISRIDVFLNFEKFLSDEEISAYRERVRRRLDYEPLQYILGWWEFYGIRFKITPAVLIPRPETETLVEECLRVIATTESPRILEIGTGSGCVSIAIAKHRECKIQAIDTNCKALALGELNAEKAGVKDKVSFLERDFFEDVEDFNEYDFVISNPPYIAADEFISLPEEIRNYEPRNALTDERDGLSYYRKMAELARRTDHKVICLAEIGDGKRAKVEEVLRERGMKEIEFIKDLKRIDRVVRFVNR